VTDSGQASRSEIVFAVSAARDAGASYGAGTGGDEQQPELADIGRLARRVLRRAVSAARADDTSITRILRDHLGPGAAGFPVVRSTWPRYDQVNVQKGLDAWLTEQGRQHKTVGLTSFRHQEFGMADLLQEPAQPFGPRAGSLATVALPARPGGATHRCVQCAVYLITEADGRLALLVRGPDNHGPIEDVSIEAVSAEENLAQRALDDVQRLGVEHNVFRGQMVSFSGNVFGPHGFRFAPGAQLSFLDRPSVRRDQVILPAQVLDGIERQVLGIATHGRRLLVSGQHLKRGVLLHGAPGTGKTHTVRYLLGRLPGVTVVVLSGAALGMIAEACSIARTLQPSAVIVEDVDLIAEERMPHMGQHPLLFQLLNEMDGLAEDADVTFLLTTNRADLLERALAQRPGRVDHAALLPLPDAEARRRLIRLYQGNLQLDLTNPDAVIARTEGVTASFIKELLRRASLFAAESADQATGPTSHDDQPLRVTDEHLIAALDQLLDTRNELTRLLLGSQAPHTAQHEPGSSPSSAS
jgi:ATPase family associated with various cellular activities (AAA)